MNFRQAAVLAAGLLIFSGPPASAEDRAGAGIGTAVAALQLEDARLQNTGWRLVTGNARWCRGARAETGLLLQDVMAYDAPGAVRRAMGIEGDIAVQAVAEGSPASDAGLRPNDELLAIEGVPTALPVAGPGDHRRLDALHKMIAGALGLRGKVLLRLRTAGRDLREIELAGVSACPSRFEVLTGRAMAQADGDRVQIGQKIGQQLVRASERGHALSDDDYGVIVAHELAHNLLHHGALLDRIGRSWSNVRATEREADRLSVWLLFNAGYDPDIALRSAEIWRRRVDPARLRAPTHEGWVERRETIASEIRRMRAHVLATGLADWSKHFIPEIQTGERR